MNQIKAAIIGCGGRGKEHAHGYAAAPDTQIIAVVDPLAEAAQSVAVPYTVPQVYDYHPEMYAALKPDIVSVCTWTGLHAQQVLDSVAAGVRAIHSEKPMAPTWGEAKRMHAACEAAGVQLTFCHQRRFGAHFIKARDLIRDGAIGTVHRIEGFCSDLFDWGTHWFDMFCFYNEETPIDWVMGQVNPTGAYTVFGVYVESAGLSYVQFANGVHALLVTGRDHGGTCSNRIIGSKGMIEVEVNKGPRVRMLRAGHDDWEVPNLEGIVPPKGDTVLSILDAIDCLRTGRKPTLSSHNALRSTELIFATYESSRRRARVTLPLDTEDSALHSMLGVD